VSQTKGVLVDTRGNIYITNKHACSSSATQGRVNLH
jgi:hypothetical protein